MKEDSIHQTHGCLLLLLLPLATAIATELLLPPLLKLGGLLEVTEPLGLAVPILLRKMRLCIGEKGKNNRYRGNDEQVTAFLSFVLQPDTAHGRHIIFVAYVVSKQSIANFPCKNAWILLLELFDVLHNLYDIIIIKKYIHGKFCKQSLTFGVVTRGLLPPMAPGRMEPVS